MSHLLKDTFSFNKKYPNNETKKGATKLNETATLNSKYFNPKKSRNNIATYNHILK